MNFIVQQGIDKVVVDNESVKQALEMLEADHFVWVRKNEEKDLPNVAKRSLIYLRN